MANDLNSAFTGLWLSREAITIGKTLYRSALLFLERGDMHYILRFNHDVDDGEGMTIEFMWDYTVTPTAIHLHPVGFPPSTQIEVPWRAAKDGALLLRFRDDWDSFYPTTMKQISDAGFEMDHVEKTIEEAKTKGWKHQLETRIPSFPAPSNSK